MAPAPPSTTFTKLATFFFPNLGQLQQQLFGRRVHRRVRWLAAIIDPDMSVTISKYVPAGRRRRSGSMMTRSDAYEEAKAYISAQGADGVSRLRSARHFRAEVSWNDNLLLNMLDGEEVADQFEEATIWWSAYTIEIGRGDVEMGYRIHFQERHKDLVLDTYLPHVRRKARAIMVEARQRKIFTNTLDHDGWANHVPFDHPKTFAKLAMDPAKKQEIMDDLEAFRNAKEYYARLGKPWKRGYLLYGPPGTGKSSMIAAIANFLDYDVYDIELTAVRSNTHLRELLIGTKRKSVIVIEDIDCSLDLTGARDKTKPVDDDGASTSAAAAVVCAEENSKSTNGSICSQVTLSGLLNFMDGLWSACGEERIIVLTTNHIQKLDPALIRKGRMDKHIEMPYCGLEAFKFLAKLYLDVESHELFGPIGELLGEAKMTPADVAEKLTRKRKYDDAVSCLADLVTELTTIKRAKGSVKGGRRGKRFRAQAY